MSLYLWLSRWPVRTTSIGSDYAAFAGCSVIGAAFIAALPVRPWLRVAAVSLYLPLTYAVLFYYSLLFVGLAFGDWL